MDIIYEMVFAKKLIEIYIGGLFGRFNHTLDFEIVNEENRI